MTSPFVTSKEVPWTRPEELAAGGFVEQALSGSGLALWDWDIHSDGVRLSAQWNIMLGSGDQPTNTTFSALAELVHSDDIRSLKAQLVDVLKGASPRYEVEHRVRTPGGQWIWVHSAGSVVKRDEAGRALRMVGANLDITKRKNAEHALRTSEECFRRAFVQGGVGFHITALDGRFLQVNQKFSELTGYSEAELLRMSVHDTQTPKGQTESRKFRQAMLNGETQSGRRERQLIRKDGSSAWVSSGMSLVRDDDGNPLHFMSVVQDITQQMLAERQIEQLATKDALTGLSNRSTLTAQMNAAIARAERSQTRLGVMFIDLDRFKAVNDMLGHAAGDELLRECAKRLSECIREVDIVARLGGDEFVVLLTDLTDTGIVAPIAERMLEKLNAPYHLHGHDARASASIGICFYPADGGDVTMLMKNADIAMYHAKGKNRNNYQFYAEEMNQRLLQRAQLEKELRAALENNEFILHYQPQVVVATGAIQGAESLIRWQHPIRGLLQPGDFIPVAEESGLIVPIGKWILNHACQTIKGWRASGVGIPYIVVNVSAAQLGDGLVTSVREALVTHGIEPGWLMLEITETMLMERVEESISILRRIRELGIRIAMDDFGTGYSSLSVLQRLPLDTLKIDRSFVGAIDDENDNARAVAIIGAIIAIAKELNLSVVAEGVETPTQLAFLRTLNCDTYQGYLYSRPIDTIMLEARFASPVKSVLEDDQGRAITMTLKVTMELPIDST